MGLTKFLDSLNRFKTGLVKGSFQIPEPASIVSCQAIFLRVIRRFSLNRFITYKSAKCQFFAHKLKPRTHRSSRDSNGAISSRLSVVSSETRILICRRLLVLRVEREFPCSKNVFEDSRYLRASGT